MRGPADKILAFAGEDLLYGKAGIPALSRIQAFDAASNARQKLLSRILFFPLPWELNDPY